MVQAQELKVTDFYMDQSDLTANQQGTMVLDQNGEKCALIKIITAQSEKPVENILSFAKKCVPLHL